MIEMYYGDKTAERSGVKLINHIIEGCQILERLGSRNEVKDAYCLHPMFQSDEALFENAYLLTNLPCEVSALVMEYRNIANAGLRKNIVTPEGIKIRNPDISPLDEVNKMLIADKVQNRKDFLQYHDGIHKESYSLRNYFDIWLEVLGVSQVDYEILTSESIFS